jgi:hypothetical protein
MTKELRNVMKEYHINVEYNDMEFDATVLVNTDEFSMSEVDVRVESIDSLDGEEYLWADVEEYIIGNWEEFETIESGEGGGGG